MKFTPYLLTAFIYSTISMHAMENDDVFFNDTLQEAQQWGTMDAETDEKSAAFKQVPPAPPPLPSNKSNIILHFKRSNQNTDQVHFKSEQKKRSNLFLLPPRKKKDLLDLDLDDEEFIPSLISAHEEPTHQNESPGKIKNIIDSLTATLQRETLRKFTYDMRGIQILDSNAYAMTILCLQVLRAKNKTFVYTGTPDIMQYIEEKGWYKFPENIVIRKKQYPYACSITDAAVALCTIKRVNEQKNALVDQEDLSKTDDDTIFKAIPASTALIKGAIITYLDQVEAIENETPKERKKRMYRNDFMQLYSPENQ